MAFDRKYKLLKRDVTYVNIQDYGFKKNCFVQWRSYR